MNDINMNTITDEEGEPIENVLEYIEGWYDAEKGFPAEANREEDYYRAYGKYQEYAAVLEARSMH